MYYYTHVRIFAVKYIGLQMGLLQQKVVHSAVDTL